MKYKSKYLYSYDNVVIGDNKIILEMQYYENNSLDTKLLHFENLNDLMKKLVNGIMFLNHNGCVCANLKPSNIFILDDGNPIISDYCQHLLCSKNSSTSNNYYFITPEQLFDKEIDEKTDIYLCGLVFYYIITNGGYLLNSYRIQDLVDDMKRVKEVIESLKILKEYRYIIAKMVEYKKMDRMDLPILESIFNPENTSNSSLKDILSVWQFHGNYKIKEKIINSILSDNKLVEEIENEFRNNISDSVLFDVVFNMCLVDQCFKSKLIVDLTNYIELIFKSRCDMIYNALMKNNSKLKINKNKIVLKIRSDNKYSSYKNAILALRTIINNHSIVLRDSHFRNGNIISILKSYPLIKKITFYHITDPHIPHFDIIMDLEEIDIVNLFRTAEKFPEIFNRCVENIHSLKSMSLVGNTFVSSPRCEYVPTSVTMFETLKLLKNLSEFNIRSNCDNHLQYVKEYNNLDSLYLDYADETNININSLLHSSSYLSLFHKFLSNIKSLNKLKRLNIKGCCLNNEKTISLLSEQLKKLPNLSFLMLNIINEDEIKNSINMLINSILTITNLKALNLLALPNRNNTIIKMLDNISKLNKLEDLEFIFPEADNNVVDCFFSNTVHLSNLKSLSIHYPPNMPNAMKDYSNGCDCLSNLKCLKLERGKDIPLFLESMKNEKWSNLEVLSLYSEDSKAFDSLPDIFSSISQLKSLSIGISNNNDEVLKSDIVICLSQLKDLEELDLSCVNIEDEYLINNFKYFNKLQKLKLKCISPNNSDLFIENMNYISSLVELSVEYIPDRIYMNRSFLRELPNLQYFMIDLVDTMRYTLQSFELNELEKRSSVKKRIEDLLLLPNTILNSSKYTKRHRCGINEIVEDIKKLCSLSLSNLTDYHFDIHYKTVSNLSVKGNPLWCLFRIFNLLVRNGFVVNLSEEIERFMYIMKLEKIIKDVNKKDDTDVIVETHDKVIKELPIILKKIRNDNNLLILNNKHNIDLPGLAKRFIEKKISNWGECDCYLNINETYRGDNVVKYLCNFYKRFNNLLYLSLYDNLITSDGIIYLCSILCYMPKLKNLILENDKGAAYLAYHLYEVEELKVLNVVDNEIKENGYNSIDKIMIIEIYPFHCYFN